MYGPHGTAEIVGQIQHKAIGRLECPETAKWASEVASGDLLDFLFTKDSSTYGQNPSSSNSANEQIVTRAAVLPSEFMDQDPYSRPSTCRGSMGHSRTHSMDKNSSRMT